ncbi:carbonic anhydrase [Pontibacter virosus]|uniref:carbonic anhydrase n=1 Tax=Pontibacter virosus TaxID=1765052 RepID=A0A2U1APK8_9BACT|nr:carbonic anhydrase [Pontibacter virosus]PVY38325.1 carbonic anhydrase [Pontibacter virosus]
MKNLLLLGCSFLLLTTQQACAQRKTNASTQDNRTTIEQNMTSPQWRKDNYIVNRDSAFANPYFALQKLRGGNTRFQQSRSIHPRQDPALIKRLSEGQSPFATIVGCSDSRVSSEILFDQGFGDLFVARTAGQVMAEASYGTIEYAYLMLGTKLVVVLGHTGCGAVAAAVKRPENPPGHIVTLINAIKPAALEAKKKQGETIDNAVRQNVINQVEELRQLESVLSRAYAEGDILIVGAVYNLATGKVEFLDETLTDLPKTSYSKRDITGL